MNMPTTPSSASLGIPLGPFIALAQYDDVSQLAWESLPDLGYRQLFGVGWTGLGYRALAASLHNQTFRTLFDTEPAASAQERFDQDHHFFGFVTNATSAAENLVYASYVTACGLRSEAITAKHLRCPRDQLLPAILSGAVTSALGQELSALLQEPPALSLFTMRDVVLHRGRLARNQFVGGTWHDKMTVASNPKELPPDWQNTFVFSDLCTDPWATWLTDYIARCSDLLLAALASVRSQS